MFHILNILSFMSTTHENSFRTKLPRLFRDFCLSVGTPIAKDDFNRIKPFLRKSDKVLDFGTGFGIFYKLLVKHKYNTTSLDVGNFSLFEDVDPLIYDGRTIPFKKDEFDVACVISVLHHTPDPYHLLKELKRVSKRIIIVEDVYDSSFQKYLTFVMDSIANFEFVGHPHSNKSEKEWEACFAKLGLKVEKKETYRFWKLFKGAAYHLTRS